MTDTASNTPVVSAAEAFAVLPSDALAHARLNQLVDDAGVVWCWNCGERPALMPHLHCAQCYADHRARRSRELARQEHPETRRWRAIFEHMTNGELTRQNGETLMRNCEGLPSATLERRIELKRRFDARFGGELPQQTSWAGRGFRRSGTNDD